jgi:hypothetical protein
MVHRLQQELISLDAGNADHAELDQALRLARVRVEVAWRNLRRSIVGTEGR